MLLGALRANLLNDFFQALILINVFCLNFVNCGYGLSKVLLGLGDFLKGLPKLVFDFCPQLERKWSDSHGSEYPSEELQRDFNNIDVFAEKQLWSDH